MPWNHVHAQDTHLAEPLSQTYEYTIQVHLPKPDTFLIFPFDRIARTKVKVAYPVDWPGTELYINSVVPKPAAFEFGPAWAQNQYLTFFLPIDKEYEIRIDGEVKVDALNIDQLKPIHDAYETFTMDKLRKFNLYVKPTALIESDNPEIVEAARQIRGNKTKLKEIVEATYDFVVERIDYSYVTVDMMNDGEFIPPQSAVETLEKGSGICGDYSRLMIALLRAQGIPARMVGGGVDVPRDRDENIPFHAWVQFYIPDVAFIDVDPTWGESGKKYISDIDTEHIRLKFSLPDDDETTASFEPFQIENSSPFIGMSGKIRYHINFTKIEALTEQEDVEDIRALAPVFYSADDGYLNPFINTVKFLFMTTVTDPTNLIRLQWASMLVAVIAVVFRVMRKTRKGKKRTRGK